MAVPPRSGFRSSAATRPGAFAASTSSSRRRHRPEFSPGPAAGPSPSSKLPDAGRDLELLAAPLQGEQVGVIKDRRARTYTAALAVKVTSFGLLDRGEQESRQAGWGGVLAGLAREGSPVSRIQWIERTVPADGDEIGRYLGEAWDRDAAPVDSVPMQSYLELTSAAPAITTDHELFVCLQIDARLAWRQIKRAGGKQGPDAGACGVLLRELEALADRLAAADVQVVGALRPGTLAAAFRVAFDPWSRPGLARLASADPDRDGVDRGRGLARRVGDVVELVPHRRHVPRDLLDLGLAAHRRRGSVPLAPAPSRPDGASNRRHDRADLTAQGDPRGRGSADKRRRRQ